jgi:hypothetical protein
MLPNQLTPESFDAYPPEARHAATARIALLRRLPLGFVSQLLRELIVYDWKFPAERREVDGQFAYLASLPPEQLARAMAPFSQLRLTPALEKADWVNGPAAFTEQLTAHLWSTHQIDAFRAAAVDYMKKATAAAAEEPPPMHRLGIAVIGQGVRSNDYRLFRKLRPHGVYFSRVKTENGLRTLVDAVAKRAASQPVRYGHWWIDGSPAAPAIPEGVAGVSYADLSPARAALQGRMQKIYEASVFDPEAFRSRMAQTQPGEIGLNAAGDGVLARFQLSLLTEGSGTQVFATTFVQWAAREAWRRAQPLTLLARFGPRQRENPMNVLLAEAQRKPELDPQGSLIDADMGAYYTWVNQQRLSGAENARFLVWFEDHAEAVAIGPGFERGQRSDGPVELRELVAKLLLPRPV